MERTATRPSASSGSPRTPHSTPTDGNIAEAVFHSPRPPPDWGSSTPSAQKKSPPLIRRGTGRGEMRGTQSERISASSAMIRRRSSVDALASTDIANSSEPGWPPVTWCVVRRNTLQRPFADDLFPRTRSPGRARVEPSGNTVLCPTPEVAPGRTARGCSSIRGGGRACGWLLRTRSRTPRPRRTSRPPAAAAALLQRGADAARDEAELRHHRHRRSAGPRVAASVR
jgi:hypothetical protein